MNIKIQMDRDFELTLNELVSKYGEDFEILNGFHESQVDFSEFIDSFVDKNVADVSIDSNANNSGKDVRSLISEKGKPMDKLLCFNKIFYELKKKYGLSTAKEWLEAEYSGKFYLHDAHTSTFFGYCFAYDLERLAREGLFFLSNYNNEPPKHLTTFLDDVIEFISYFSNRSAGACGIPNVLVWTYYFWKHDVENGYYIKDPDYYLRQCFQKLIYRMNQRFLRIIECAFVNVSIFDHKYAEQLFGGLVFPDGTYFIDQVDEFIEHQKIFMECVSEIRNQNMFTFPVLTYSLLYQKENGGFQDEPFAKWCSDHNCKWGDSNFFVSSDVTTLSNCCRLLSDTSKLDPFINSIGGTALSIGSVKVNTINLMRIALESGGDKQKYLDILADRVDLCCKVLDVHRHIIERNIEKGLLPNYCEGGMELDKQYSTIGINALASAMKEFGFLKEDEFGYVYYTDEGIEFARDIFGVINAVKDSYNFDYKFNVESIPGEKAAIVLCSKDNILFNRKEEFIYPNQWHPLSDKCTLQERLKVSAILDNLCSGGSILHISMEAPFNNEETAWDTLNQIAESGVIYFAFNYNISACEDNHAWTEPTDICPVCGKPEETKFVRIVGYLVPVERSFSSQRKAEYNSRYWYDLADSKHDVLG